MLAVWASALPAGWMCVALVVIVTPLTLLVAAAGHAPPARKDGDAPKAPIATLSRSPLLWLFGLSLLLYAGIESGLSGWTTEYLVRTTSLGKDRAAMVLSSFWLAVTVGRTIGAFGATRVSQDNILWVSLGGAVIGSALLVTVIGHAGLTIAALVLLGLSLGPVYPTLIAAHHRIFSALARRRHQHRRGGGRREAGCCFPGCKGALLQRSGAVASILLVAICTLVMLSIHAARRRVARVTADAGGRWK